jgi:hypothetical protein
MLRRNASISHSYVLMGWLVLCTLFMTYPTAVQASVPVARPPYTISIFALSQLGQNGYTHPDSLVQWHDHILVGFGNGVAKDAQTASPARLFNTL